MPLKCYTCNGNHTCRECPVEKRISGHMKKTVGEFMENRVANSVKCPKCEKQSLYVLGNNSPSLDLKCSECDDVKIECKSKCLSVKHLPKDLVLNHGSFIDYQSRQEECLHFIIVIYGIDRIKKLINIRKILFVDDDYIKHSDNFEVRSKSGTSLSNIFIKDHSKIKSVRFSGTSTFSYLKYFNQICQKIRK